MKKINNFVFLFFALWMVSSCATTQNKDTQENGQLTDEAILSTELPKIQEFLKEGKMKAAKNRYRGLVQQFNNRAVYHYLLGQVYSENGKKWEHYVRCILLDPLFYDCYLERGSIYTQWRIWGRAEKDFLKAQSIRPSSNKHEAGLANISLEKGEYNTAIQLYQKIYQADPNNKESILGLAKAYQKQEKYAESIDWYKKYVEKDSTRFRPLYSLSFLLVQQKRNSEATTYLEQSHKLSPKSFVVLSTLGKIYKEQGKTDQAISFYALASAHPRAHFDIFNELGKLYKSKDMTEKAIESFEKAYQAKKEDEEVLKELSELQLSKKNYERVEFLMETAIRTSPKNQLYHRYYIQALQGGNKYIDLIQAFQGAIKEFPNSSEFKKGQEALLQTLGIQVDPIEGGSIRSLVSKANSRIKTCFKARNKVKQDLKGKIVFQVKVLNSGTRVLIQKSKGTLSDPVLEACIKWTYQRIKFEKTGFAIDQNLFFPM